MLSPMPHPGRPAESYLQSQWPLAVPPALTEVEPGAYGPKGEAHLGPRAALQGPACILIAHALNLTPT